jgi:uracil-DNA glycosylase
MNDPLRDAEVARGAPGLRLDARQRAMLEEMGVKVWAPVARAAAGPLPQGLETREKHEVRERRAAPTSTAGAPVDPRRSPPSRDPAAAAAAAATGTTPTPTPPPRRAAGSGALVFEPPQRLYARLDEDGIAPPAQGGWLVVADMPPEADGHPGEPFAGEAGRLLDNMLRALRLHEAPAAVHLMRVHRGAGGAAGGVGGMAGQGGEPGSPDEPFATPAGELAPRVVLAMGPLAAQALLRSGEPLGRLRGRAVPLASAHAALDGVSVVATYHPAYLLRNPADKARAWADLCLAADRFAP